MNHTIMNRQHKTLSVQVEGPENAPVIIFSNSLGTDKGMWDPQAEYFKQHYRVIRYDTRGHGKSDVMHGTTLQQLGEDVLDMMDALNISRAHFCGISMGGLTGLWLGIYYPERFSSITVANTAAKIGTQDAWLARADAVQSTGLESLVKTTHSRWFSANFDYQRNLLAQQVIQSLANTPAHGYANACRALALADLREKISSITVPTLIIAGSLDPVTTVTDAEFIHQQIKDSQLFLIEASHLSNIEQPEIFTREIKRFVESIH
ncbi:3-oxoadipate enol-lactonase [Acinetobacter sp. WZC-1]|uniref:3-oxoadipate enol-lactonase n=1 Tax=Acinetobacter sp. WZC-1 TaxID=3459034 RepID=UPI00403E1BA9